MINWLTGKCVYNGLWLWIFYYYLVLYALLLIQATSSITFRLIRCLLHLLQNDFFIKPSSPKEHIFNGFGGNVRKSFTSKLHFWNSLGGKDSIQTFLQKSLPWREKQKEICCPNSRQLCNVFFQLFIETFVCKCLFRTCC